MPKRMFRITITLITLVGLLSILGIYACGGGNGSGSASVSSEDASYGKVGILMADAPTDDFTHIWITITDVTLIPMGSGDAIKVFTSDEGYRLDLLALRDETFLLTLHDRIPAGKYEKIRVGVSAIDPVPKEGSSVCPELEVKLPSGKIDFIPDGGVEVIGGETVYVRLDIDAKKSINLHPAGDPCKLIFRPVVFIDIIKGEPICFWRHSYRGTIKELITHTDSEGATITDGFILNRERTCLGTLEVDLASDAIIFTADGIFGTPAELKANQEVLVRGIMDSEGVLNAKAVIIGDALVLKGTAEGAVVAVEEGGDLKTFDLTLDAGQELVGNTPMSVIVYPQTVISSGCSASNSNELELGGKYEIQGRDYTQEDISVITNGTPLIVVGKYDISADVFKAVGILVLPTPVPVP